jgi:hypothetical protein
LRRGDPLSAGFVHSVIEGFAQEFASVVRQFLKDKAWQGTECIFVGGGMSSRQIGAVAMGRAEMLLKVDDIAIPLMPIRHHADDAGLIGAIHLAPPWIFEGQDAILAVDIGGTEYPGRRSQAQPKNERPIFQKSRFGSAVFGGIARTSRNAMKQSMSLPVCSKASSRRRSEQI